ncbi:hypothetical protein GOBAR_DD21899 [Gossypium barbadense]|nr:hypothetical protein GOBAR_DD21899 [Gossypium barbadense]
METILHAFYDFQIYFETLALVGINDGLLNVVLVSCIDWLKLAMRTVDKDAFTCLMVLIWNLWNERNNAFLEGRIMTSHLILDRVKGLHEMFRVYNLIHKPMILSRSQQVGWRPLDGRTLKVEAKNIICELRLAHSMGSRHAMIESGCEM